MHARTARLLVLFAATILTTLAAGPAALAWDTTREVTATADGKTLVFKRLRNAGGPPVILAHGLSASSFFWDVPAKSYAAWLADRGYDVWMANFRSCGRAGFESERVVGASFDEVALLDVPAIVDKVTQATGGQRPFWVGHSMGGMVAYAWLGGATFATVVTHRIPYFTLAGVRYHEVRARRVVGDAAAARARNASLRGFVAIGSPGAMEWRIPAERVNLARDSYWDYNILLTALAHSPSANTAAAAVQEVPIGRTVDFLLTYLPAIPFVGPSLRTYLLVVAGRIGSTFLTSQALYAPNVEDQVLRDTFATAGEDASTVVYRQLLDGIRTRSLRELHTQDTARAPYAYADSYGRITVPALIIAGDRDKLANDEKVRERVFQRLGSADATYLGVALAGHLDLVLGKRAEADVWVPVEAWMATR
jgi:pimeloyl-ACP methyl ester carboxylesterase